MVLRQQELRTQAGDRRPGGQDLGYCRRVSKDFGGASGARQPPSLGSSEGLLGGRGGGTRRR